MTMATESADVPRKTDRTLSLYHLLDPEVLANPYPLYHKLRNDDPVHWDSFLHAWVVTRYADVVHTTQSGTSAFPYSRDHVRSTRRRCLERTHGRDCGFC